MKLYDVNGALQLRCEVCGVSLRGQADATIGIHGPELIAVHSHCRPTFQQFFLNSISREITLAEFAAEVTAAV